MIDSHYLNVLRKICTDLLDCRCPWVITGSLGMALQGMVIAVNDIDIQTDRDGAFEIESRLSATIAEPVRYLVSARIRSYLGRLEMDGIQVEIMGDIAKRLDDRTWEAPIQVAQHRRWLAMDGLQIPVLSLIYEYEAYLKLGRMGKADMIRQFLQQNRLGQV